MHVVEPIFEYYRLEGFTMGSNFYKYCCEHNIRDFMTAEYEFQILLILRKIVLVLPTKNLAVIKRHASYNLFKAQL